MDLFGTKQRRLENELERIANTLDTQHISNNQLRQELSNIKKAFGWSGSIKETTNVYEYIIPKDILDRSRDNTNLNNNSHLSDKEMKQIELAFKDYMSLSSVGYNVPMVSNDVDELWHTYLLNPTEYIRFCISCFGKIIAHYPEYNGGKQISDSTKKNYITSMTKSHRGNKQRDEYMRHYGMSPSDNTLIYALLFMGTMDNDAVSAVENTVMESEAPITSYATESSSGTTHFAEDSSSDSSSGSSCSSCSSCSS